MLKRKLYRWETALLLTLAVVLLWGMWSVSRQQALSDKVVRLHILANSDTESDQTLKLQVRDAVLEEAEQLLQSCGDREEAQRVLNRALPEIQTLAENEIAARGYDYAVTAELTDTAFPTREYGDFTLPAGRYLALRIVIGAGEGHNWWCVVFPPLCAESVTDVAETAMSAGFSEDDVKLMTEEENGYVLKFKSIELWQNLKAYLSRER